jgi:hypothetical protein
MMGSAALQPIGYSASDWTDRIDAGRALSGFVLVDPANGVDGTANGSAAKPFGTLQGAFAAGHTKFLICAGDAGTLDVTHAASGPFWIYGFAGADYADYTGSMSLNPPTSYPDNVVTECTVRNNAATTNHCHIHSNHQVVINLVAHSEYKQFGGFPANVTPDFFVSNALVGSVETTAADGTAEEGQTSIGGNGAILRFDRCLVLGDVTLTAGQKQNEEGSSLDGEGAVLIAWNTRFFGLVSLPGGTSTQSQLSTVFCVFSQTPSGTFVSVYRFSLFLGEIAVVN